jgi:hypothetical protein
MTASVGMITLSIDKTNRLVLERGDDIYLLLRLRLLLPQRLHLTEPY